MITHINSDLFLESIERNFFFTTTIFFTQSQISALIQCAFLPFSIYKLDVDCVCVYIFPVSFVIIFVVLGEKRSRLRKKKRYTNTHTHKLDCATDKVRRSRLRWCWVLGIGLCAICFLLGTKDMSLTATKSDTLPMKSIRNIPSTSQAFCLRWNNFQSNMLDVFERLFLDERFVDVTLACEGQLIKAHKMVLSASSSYFHDIFTTTPCSHPVVIMRDIAAKDLRKILEFMYKGEINVNKQEIASLLTVAEVLHVRGLAQIDANDNEPQPSTSNASVGTVDHHRKTTTTTTTTTPKLNRLLKRSSTRESSVESLVLIEDECTTLPIKQIKQQQSNDISTKNAVAVATATAHDSLIEEVGYNSMHEMDDDFFEYSAPEYENDDFDPIDAIQIKHERDNEDIINKFSTDNGVSE